MHVIPASFMELTIADEYKSSLSDLTFNSKPLINMLTMLADENKKHASDICKTIIDHVNSVDPGIKLPALYLIDSIIKNVGEDYLKIFTQYMISLFISVFQKVDENTRCLMFKLRQTWIDIFPNRMLYNLDLQVQKIDPAWPITAKVPSSKSSASVNNKPLGGSSDERKKLLVPSTLVVHEEKAIKRTPPAPVANEDKVVKHAPPAHVIHGKVVKNAPPAHVVQEKVVKNAPPAHVVQEKVVKNAPPAHVVQEKVVKSAAPAHVIQERIVKNAPPAHVIKEKVVKNAPPAHVIQEKVVKNSPPAHGIEQKLVKHTGPPQIFPEKVVKPVPSTHVIQEKVVKNAPPVQEKAVKDAPPAQVVQEKVVKNSSPADIINEEKLIKQRQEELLKQLLEKQEQLKQLEKKKLLKTLRKKNSTNVGNVLVAPGIKQNIRDPRIAKMNKIPQNVPVQKSSPLSRENLPTNLPTIVYAVAKMCEPTPPSLAMKTFKDSLKSHDTTDTTKQTPLDENNSSSKNSELQSYTEVTIPAKTKNTKRHSLNKTKINKSTRKETENKNAELSVKEPEKSIELGTVSKTIEKKNISSKKSSFDRLNELANMNKKSRKKTLKNENQTISVDNKSADHISNKSRTNKINDKSEKSTYNKMESCDKTDSSEKKSDSIEPVSKQNDFTESLSLKKDSDSAKVVKKECVFKIEKSDEYADKTNELVGITQTNVNETSIKKVDSIKPIEVSKAVFKSDDSVNDDFGPKTDFSVKSEDKCFSHKDEDLRVLAIPPIDTVPAIRDTLSKICQEESDKDEIGPPRKKIKCEDIENLNPELRMDSPDLYRKNDQDFRHSEMKTLKNYNSQGWAQFKAANPDQCSPISYRQQRSANKYAGKLRFRRQHFGNYNCFGPPGFNQYGPPRYPRRYGGPAHFNRERYNQFLHHSNIDNLFQQLEEKYLNGYFSEFEYWDLYNSLKKMFGSNEFHYPDEPMLKRPNFPYQQKNCEMPPRIRDVNENKPNICKENLLQQKPPPSIKPFVLDNRERLIYFVDDRAVVLLDNNEPHELTFENECRSVFIEGLPGPLTLNFDGKPIEFELDGRRHTVRLGIPGREVYINNYPYEVQFGGPPISVMLREGRFYKVSLSGPPPQVKISDKPEYELFSKCHGNKIKYINKPTTSTATEKVEKPSGPFLQDTDMRVNPEIVQKSNVPPPPPPPFIKSVEDMDWRQVPSSSNIAPEPVQKLCNETVPKLLPPWPNKCGDIRLPENVPKPTDLVSKEKKEYNWEAPANPNLQANLQVQPYQAPINSSQQRWQSYGQVNWQAQNYRSYFPVNQPNHQKENMIRSSWVPRQRPPVPLNNSSIPNKIPLLPPPPLPPFMPGISSSTISSNSTTSQITPITLNVTPPAPLDVPKNHLNNQATMTQQNVQNAIKPSQPNMQVDVASLLEKLVAAGIITPKPYELPSSSPEAMDTSTSEKEVVENEEDNTAEEEILVIDFTPENLKTHYPFVISALYKGLQCETCGMRFKAVQNELYSAHLNWHFRVSNQEKDKELSRCWFYEAEDWIQIQEFEDLEERGPNYFEIQPDDIKSEEPEMTESEAPDGIKSEEVEISVSEEPELPESEELPSALAEDNEDTSENVSQPPENITSVDDEHTEKEEKVMDESILENEEFASIIDSILNKVCSNLENEVCEETPDSSVDREVPFEEEEEEEEEILEGKPGEEEIIGVISESDVESEAVPQSESKMVIMQSGGITLKVKAESLQCSSPTNLNDKSDKPVEKKDSEDIDFRPPTPDPRFRVMPKVFKGQELSGLCCIM